MTDERHKPSARPTARDVPFVRGAGTDSEPTPRGVRPAQLPRDPTYEAELAQVELAVLRDPKPREDPSTKQGGRLAQQSTLKPPPESVTPESPLARANIPDPRARSPQPPSSGGRSVASGTLLSVGAVDPRGKTERTLETPRMFISQHQGSEAYFKPAKIPAVTVHQTIETETVKLSDSIDPRRAKTIPRLDRAALAQLSEMEDIPDSEAPLAMSEPASSLDVSSAHSPRWNQEAWDAEAERQRSSAGLHDGQIHASLSPFRDQPASSFSLDGAPTRVEPLAGRRPSDVPEPPSVVPDTSTVPTQRDLPAHRIESSQPPPPPARSSPVNRPISSARASAGPQPTTASIAVEEPALRPGFVNYAAFVAALLFAIVVGLYVTRDPDDQAKPPAAPPAAPLVAQPRHPLEPAVPAAPPPPVATEAKAAAEVQAPLPPALALSAAASSKSQPAEVPKRVAPIAAPPKAASASDAPAPSPRSPSAPKPARETIF